MPTQTNYSSTKHWSSYILGATKGAFGVLILICSLGLPYTLVIALVGGLITMSAIRTVLVLSSIKWTLLESDLVIESGWLPWKKSYYSVPFSDIYEAYYTYSFFGKYLGFGDISVRRTDGVSTTFGDTWMADVSDLSRVINVRVQELKKARQVTRPAKGYPPPVRL